MTKMSAPRKLGAGKKLLFSFVVTVMFLVAAELVVRGWVYYLREDYERYDSDTDTFHLVPGEHRALRRSVLVNSDGFAGAELREDGDDLWRIVSVGDSNTFGSGNDLHTYPAILGRLLDQRASDGRRYEVVNAGIEGLTSLQALRRLRSKVLPLGPEVVTIYVGWNDLMKFDPVSQGDSSALSEASRFIDQLWLVKGFRKVLFFYARPYIDPPATGPESRTGRFSDFTPSMYIENVKAMISEVRSIGALPVLFTMATVVREDTTVQDVRERRIVFPYYASAYGVGDLLDLVSAYTRATELVAIEENVPLFRLDRVLNGHPDSQDLFLDTMHPTDQGRKIIAEALLRFLDENELLGEAPPDPDTYSAP